jgi:Uma2 family endonuclease
MLRRVTQSKDSRRRATYDDVLNAPEHMVAELIDGVLYTSPRPATRHALAYSRLGLALGPLQERTPDPGSWWIIDEPELHFGEDVLVPDLAAWRCEHMPEYPDASFFTLAPDWVCEILSPSTARLDRTKKRAVYSRERIPYAWFLDPIARTLEVLSLNEAELRTLAVHSGHERVRAVPFEAVEIELARLWGATPAS